MFNHELAWKTVKDFLESRGVADFYGSKDTTRAAFKESLIENGETWIDMILSRNLTTQTYDEGTAAAKANNILNNYFNEFNALLIKLEDLAKAESS